eukprot:CAMPEP_0119133842 /NCGR_PEP_ID=MMETSP1310-20130426/13986_1 /TAXON_ID=464262 /ORGANISM="Genus nov. species nov., Strain RCC2339" /LENGTH=284 /DNA_ID=CAMNT_0007124563 /DNA_START=92 /DNA_END=946 /DNA_ORIENTATION=+
MGCCVSVPENAVGIIERFGAYDRLATPGFNCLVPCCGESAIGILNLRVQQLAVECETKTKDNVFVSIVVSVQMRALEESAYDAFYKLSNPTQQIRAYVFDVVRASVPKIELDAVYETKDELAHAIRDELSKDMRKFGYEIVQSLIIDIMPAKNVCSAMNEINANLRLRVAQADRAEAEKIQTVKAAEADADSKYLAGVGIARQRRHIVDGLRESVIHFAESMEDTTAKDVMDLVLVTQYFDTLKDLGEKSKKMTVFVPHSPAHVGKVAGEIRQGFLRAPIEHIE